MPLKGRKKYGKSFVQPSESLIKNVTGSKKSAKINEFNRRLHTEQTKKEGISNKMINETCRSDKLLKTISHVCSSFASLKKNLKEISTNSYGDTAKIGHQAKYNTTKPKKEGKSILFPLKEEDEFQNLHTKQGSVGTFNRLYKATKEKVIKNSENEKPKEEVIQQISGNKIIKHKISKKSRKIENTKRTNNNFEEQRAESCIKKGKVEFPKCNLTAHRKRSLSIIVSGM